MTLLTTVFAQGTHAGRAAAAAGNAGYYYFETDTQTLFQSTGTSWVQLAASAAGGSLAIGDAVGSGTSGEVLYVDSSAELAQSTNLSFDGTNLAVAGDVHVHGVSYSWPSAAGAGVLTSDSGGALSWAAGGGGSLAIGDAVGSGTANSALFIDPSGNLAQDATGYQYFGSGHFALSDGGSNSATLVYSGYAGAFQYGSLSFTACNNTAATAGNFSDGTRTVILCDGTHALVSDNPIELAGVSYTWPTSAAAGVLTSDSGGALSWAAAGGSLAIGDAVGSSTADYALYVDGSGNLADEQFVATSRGGTGLDGSAASDGQLLIGNGSGFSLAALTSTGSTVTITDGAGTINLEVAGGGSLAIGDAVGSGMAGSVLYLDSSGNLAQSPYISFDGASLTLTNDLLLHGEIWSNDTAAGSTLGSVVAKLPIYDLLGSLVGYAPLYDTIT